MTARLAKAGGAAVGFAAIFLFAGVAQAQGFEAPWRGLYVGGGGNFSDVSVEVGSACYDYDCWWGDYAYYEDGDGDYGYTLHAGWRVHDYVALELGYVDTGDIRWEEDLVYFPEFNDYYNNRVDFSAQITQVSVLGILPFDRYEVYLKLGAGFWDGESLQRLDQSFGTDVVNRSVSDSGEDVLNARNDSSVDSMLLEVQWRFGAGKAASIQPSAPPTATP